ncbi:prephenate dehydrogenase [Listeria booriae]|uniref:Prephenate dehydrogenase n=1 Tax=Listeria booriae TaxID=1552123 RepID=A0A842F0W3_9LIST|nr:prephenate dehydrogenase [Listeria booriae]MBC2105192.1 prephenate dehydrogenase [Listeria booriae]MBC2206658.1 prephenate dehydrogenase [Listeria booriae]MBC2242584.1 prephenate dehydrogenase [Listeria booriae]
MKGTVVIVGLGLIGGSIALCIRAKHPQAHIIGVDISEQTILSGDSLGIIDEGTTNLADVVSRADLLVFCCPVQQTERFLAELPSYVLKENVIITDTGSTKQRVMEQATAVQALGHVFIGGHPMAGSHKSGVTAAKSLLFENAYYLLTPSEGENPKHVADLRVWLEGTNAKFLELSAKEHDTITGMLSHLPHIVAAALVNQTSDFTQKHPAAFRLAAGGFRDITRIASSDPTMWTDISLSNKEALRELLGNWRDGMNEALAMLEKEDATAIHHFFDTAKEFRDSLPVHQEGAIPSFYDLFVDVPDYPGVISEVTGFLAQEEISLINIKILETREDIMGILQITFQNEKDRERAKRCIEKYSHYQCHF